MDKTLDRLESMFNKADADLDYMARKLDNEFENESQLAETPLKENPSKVLEKIGEIRKEYAAIVEETKAIQDAQQEAMTFFRSQITTLCDTLVKLETNVGKESEVTPDQIEVQSLLGLAAVAAGPSSDSSAAETTYVLASSSDELCAAGDSTENFVPN